VALVRILIDGYSLLHAWRALAPRHAPHSAGARDALIGVLTRFQDTTGTPVTLFFDGQGAPAGVPRPISTPRLEILYSRAGQTADDLIERVTYRLRPYGEVLVVTDDLVERDTVIGLGGMAQSCDSFISQVTATLGELAEDLKHHNRRERDAFRRR
jgi:predicted RNA-binding protein with PIN domain